MARKRISIDRKKILEHEVDIMINRFRKEFDFKIEPIPNSFRKAEELGIFIISIPAPDNFSGLTMSDHEDTMIVTNSNTTLGRQNFSIWHEAYHWYAKDGKSISYFKDADYDEIEYKADYFSSEILMPRELVLYELKKIKRDGKNIQYLSYADLCRLQNLFQVSCMAMLTRIINITGASDELRNRYSKASDKTKARNLNIENGFNGLLEENTNPYITAKFFDYISSNLNNGRISNISAEKIIKSIEEAFNNE